MIDEFSMLGKTFLYWMSNHVSIAKRGAASDTALRDEFFGGINVVLIGDLHQFPPVVCNAVQYLFHPANLIIDDAPCKGGRRIYESFDTVVILKEQIRVVDQVWLDFLHRLRRGVVDASDIAMLKSLVVHRNGEGALDFSKSPWDECVLVTPRHAVRKAWNHAALRKMCKNQGKRLLVINAEDRISYHGEMRELTWAEKYAVALRLKTRGQNLKRDLPRSIELAKGMKVLVTGNLQTDLDVTNGARGELVDVVLDPREPPLGDSEIVTLQYLPAYILVKMKKTRASRLEDHVIPLEAVDVTMQITMKSQAGEHKTVKRTVHRRQFAITAAYVFTDYRAQGQTIPYVLVDIASPPTGKLSLFNLYVALSRSSGRQTIRLLRDFDEKGFLQSHNPDLLLEDERLEDLDQRNHAAWKALGGEERMRRDISCSIDDL